MHMNYRVVPSKNIDRKKTCSNEKMALTENLGQFCVTPEEFSHCAIGSLAKLNICLTI